VTICTGSDAHDKLYDVVLLLTSAESRYLTGVSLPVDAGSLLKQSTTTAGDP
jgi:hypothetical protein